MKAWAARERFQAGTNMRAWTFIILRNHFLSQKRRARFTGDWDDLAADRLLAAPAGQDKQLELADMQRGLMQLPENQRKRSYWWAQVVLLMKKPLKSAVLPLARSKAGWRGRVSRSRRY